MRSTDITVLILTAIFYLILMVRAALLYHMNGINPFAILRGKRGVALIPEILFVVGFPYWTAAVIISATRSAVAIMPPALARNMIMLPMASYAGIGAIFLSLCIFLAALISFGSSWRIGIDTANPGRLATGGIFSISRNPIFIALNLLFSGITLCYPSPFFIAAAVIIVVANHNQIRHEEKFLSGQYGEEYCEYCSRVRRYL